MNNLDNIIKTNAQEYYTTGKQKLSDDVFDAVVDELKKTDPNNEILTNTGWGYKLEDKSKIKHINIIAFLMIMVVVIVRLNRSEGEPIMSSKMIASLAIIIVAFDTILIVAMYIVVNSGTVVL